MFLVVNAIRLMREVLSAQLKLVRASNLHFACSRYLHVEWEGLGAQFHLSIPKLAR